MDSRSISWQAVADMPKNPRFPPKPRIVEIVVFTGVQILDVAGPLQAFTSANDYALKAALTRPYDVRVVAQKERAITASAGLTFAAANLSPARSPLDTLIVAGGPGIRGIGENKKLVAWVRKRARRARRVTSVCTGAFLLGAAGLLDGRRAVTHWTECDTLAKLYPAIKVEPDPIFVRDGAVWTSAGVTAGIDLALALIEEDLGRPLALAVARHLVMFLKRPGGQSQFSAALELQEDEKFGALHEWIASHVGRDLSLPVLAREAKMSERSFSRRYVEATGTTPARAVEKLRVEAARMMLSDSKLPVKRIAARCGFGSEETMRRSFLRNLSATPQDYRARFSV
jgi:transcriptional regulator GlxA family with amidase domain